MLQPPDHRFRRAAHFNYRWRSVQEGRQLDSAGARASVRSRLCIKTQTSPQITLIALIYTDQKVQVVPLRICKSVSSVFIRGEFCFCAKHERTLFLSVHFAEQE